MITCISLFIDKALVAAVDSTSDISDAERYHAHVASAVQSEADTPNNPSIHHPDPPSHSVWAVNETQKTFFQQIEFNSNTSIWNAADSTGYRNGTLLDSQLALLKGELRLI